MSEVKDTASGTPADLTLESMRALALENAALAFRLRGVQIPQHIGMAAASKALAVDLPRVLTAQIEADVKSGALAERWESALARAAESPKGADLEPTLGALVILLAEQARAAGRYLSVRGEEWSSDAHRLEGQAGALEAQSDRLMSATNPERSPSLSAPDHEKSATGS